jgi:hypothetical protein
MDSSYRREALCRLSVIISYELSGPSGLAFKCFSYASISQAIYSNFDEICQCFYMLPATYLRLTAEDRLAVLRMADSQRKWSSLDNRRLCLHCHRLMTGRQIEITRSRHGRYVLHCPTTNCASNPSEWIYAPRTRAERAGRGEVRQTMGLAVSDGYPNVGYG